MVLLLAGVHLPLQALWISYAPISSIAARYYHVGTLEIALFATIFPIVFLAAGWPAIRAINRHGVHRTAAAAALLAATTAVCRGLSYDNYTFAMTTTVFMAAAAPALALTWPRIVLRWFARDQRVTALSVLIVSNLLGMAIGMVATPVMASTVDLGDIQKLYGGVLMFSAIAFALLAREEPAAIVQPGAPPVLSRRASLRFLSRRRPFLVILFSSGGTMGTFQGVNVWIEQIVSPQSSTDGHFSAAFVGLVMLVGAAMGCITWSALSDIAQRRVSLISISLLLEAVGLFALHYSGSPGGYLAGFTFGYFAGANMAIGFQYAIEIGSPAQEVISGWMIQLAGQLAVVYVYVMAAWRSWTGSFDQALTFSAALMAVLGIVIWFLPEPEGGIGIGSHASHELLGMVER